MWERDGLRPNVILPLPLKVSSEICSVWSHQSTSEPISHQRSPRSPNEPNLGQTFKDMYVCWGGSRMQNQENDPEHMQMNTSFTFNPSRDRHRCDALTLSPVTLTSSRRKMMWNASSTKYITSQERKWFTYAFSCSHLWLFGVNPIEIYLIIL